MTVETENESEREAKVDSSRRLDLSQPGSDHRCICSRSRCSSFIPSQPIARSWPNAGRLVDRAAIASGHPDQAIVALRTALSYAPGERSYELLLAQALGDAGHTEEAYNYFLGLWETQPGDGFINLRLARLAAKKNDMQAAINYYRAAIYGTWEGDGIVRRREVRLELSRYLIAHHDLSSARTELLIAGGNAPDDLASP